MSETKKPSQKDLWKATQLEYLHNCFIGISNLTCSNSDCPLVYHWGDLEKKQSKKGKCAFYLVSKKENSWVVVDLEKYEENDLGTYDNIEIKFKSGKSQKTKPKNLIEPKKEKSLFSFIFSGSEPKKSQQKEIFLKDEEIILFFNNSSKTSNLQNAEEIYLNDIWDIKDKIKWDRDKSKKKVFLFTENEVSQEIQAKRLNEAEKDYVFWIGDPDITNEIKKHEIYSPATGTEERNRLYKDFQEELSELKEVYGIRHNSQAKEERQNNPEIDMIKSPFLALERDKWRERMKSIKEFVKKGGCQGKHTLSYGSYQEHQQEILLAEEVENLEENKSERTTRGSSFPKEQQSEQKEQNFLLEKPASKE